MTKLSITYEDIILDDVSPQYYNCSIPLTGFGNLTSLEIFNVFGKQDTLVEDISSLLARSPSLNCLGLGLACCGDWERVPEVVVIPGKCDFLAKLCQAYNNVSKNPLSLDTLTLGWGLCVLEPELPEVGNYLELLFKPAELRKLHMYNGYVRLGSPYAFTRRMPTDWDLLKDCTSLHHLGINRLEAGVKNWLNNAAINVKEVIFAGRSIKRNSSVYTIAGFRRSMFSN